MWKEIRKKTSKYLKNIDFWLPVENDSHQVMTAYKQLLGASEPIHFAQIDSWLMNPY